jgi:hypothetical protein
MFFQCPGSATVPTSSRLLFGRFVEQQELRETQSDALLDLFVKRRLWLLPSLLVVRPSKQASHIGDEYVPTSPVTPIHHVGRFASGHLMSLVNLDA